MSFTRAAIAPYRNTPVEVQFTERLPCNCCFCGAARVPISEIDGQCARCRATLYGAYQGVAASQRNLIRRFGFGRMSEKSVEGCIPIRLNGVPASAYSEIFSNRDVQTVIVRCQGERGGVKKRCVRETIFWDLEWLVNFFAFHKLKTPAAAKRGYGCFKATKAGDMLCIIPPLHATHTQEGGDTDSFTEKLDLELSICLLTRQGNFIFDDEVQEFGPDGVEGLKIELLRFPSLFNLVKSRTLHPDIFANCRSRLRALKLEKEREAAGARQAALQRRREQRAAAATAPAA